MVLATTRQEALDVTVERIEVHCVIVLIHFLREIVFATGNPKSMGHMGMHQYHCITIYYSTRIIVHLVLTLRWYPVWDL